MFEREIGLLGFGDQWRSSTERLSIQTDPLLAILKELRNYETHLTFAGRRRHTEVDLRTVVSPMDHRSFFFSPISFCQFSELRNIRQGRSPVTQTVVDDFNNLALTHTVEAIVDLALDRLSATLATFLNTVQVGPSTSDVKQAGGANPTPPAVP